LTKLNKELMVADPLACWTKDSLP